MQQLRGQSAASGLGRVKTQVYAANPRYPFQGHFRCKEVKVGGRYRKTQPPKNIGSNSTTKEADFLQFGHDAGPLCIECKNYREWTYPHHEFIKERGGPGCLNRFSASISGVSAGVRLPSGMAVR
jgi:hypothetical protein